MLRWANQGRKCQPALTVINPCTRTGLRRAVFKNYYSMKKTWIICLTMTLVLGACVKKGQQEAGGEYPIREELVGEVKTITNPDYPRDGAFQYAFIEEVSIGSDDPDEESVLNRPVSLKVDPAGRIYVFDLGDIDIKVFDPDGTHTGTIGRQGQGPGEFSGAVKFDIMISKILGSKHIASIYFRILWHT